MKLLRRPIVPFAAILIIGATCSVQIAIAKKNKKDPATVQMDEQKRSSPRSQPPGLRATARGC